MSLTIFLFETYPIADNESEYKIIFILICEKLEQRVDSP